MQSHEEGANEPAGIFNYRDDAGGGTLARAGKRERGRQRENISADKDEVCVDDLALVRLTGKGCR